MFLLTGVLFCPKLIPAPSRAGPAAEPDRTTAGQHHNREEPAMTYTCTAHSTDEQVLVHVTGDVDFAVSDLLWKDIEPWLVPTKSVVVDCSGITFLDSMGLRTLLRVEAYTRENGVGLTLAD